MRLDVFVLGSGLDLHVQAAWRAQVRRVMLSLEQAAMHCFSAADAFGLCLVGMHVQAACGGPIRGLLFSTGTYSDAHGYL